MAGQEWFWTAIFRVSGNIKRTMCEFAVRFVDIQGNFLYDMALRSIRVFVCSINAKCQTKLYLIISTNLGKNRSTKLFVPGNEKEEK